MITHTGQTHKNQTTFNAPPPPSVPLSVCGGVGRYQLMIRNKHMSKYTHKQYQTIIAATFCYSFPVLILCFSGVSWFMLMLLITYPRK